jgi:flagellar P-ring protein precursor FlgI
MRAKIVLMLMLAALFVSPSIKCFSEPAPTRVKDIAHVLEAKDNQLMGFGLVAGLKNTGDTVQTVFTKQALTNVLSRMGITPQDKEFKSRNIAAVMVTAKLPPFVNVGQKIDVTVSSLGDATSLQGGTLLMTPLEGADDNTYAVAQGQLSFGVATGDFYQTSERMQMNVGRIINGGIVEKEVPVSLEDNYISIVIDKPDYTTATRIVDALVKQKISARARDAATIVVSKEASMDMVKFISLVESTAVIPDIIAKVVINEQSGVVVMGEDVRIAPVAVSYGNVNVSVAQFSSTEGGGNVIVSGATMADLISALNAIGVRPKDVIAILQAAKAAGAISADIEVI